MLASRIAPLIATAAIACSPFDPDLGPHPFLCGLSTPRCPDGYVCVDGPGSDQICTLAASDRDGGADDGAPGCAADDDREPNDTAETATMIPSGTDMIDAALCPQTDIDFYELTVDTTGESVRADVMYDSSNGTLAIDLLNSTGAVIRSATRVDSDPDHLRVDFDNLASGSYFARVQAVDADFRAGYQATFIVSAGPLPP